MEPCPFCRCIDMQVHQGPGIYFVRCPNCGAEGPSAPTEKAAIRKWDSRKKKRCKQEEIGSKRLV